MEYLNEFLDNKCFFVAVLSWTIAQHLKVLFFLLKNKKLNLSLFISSGSMPSSHSAFVTALSASIGLKDGFNSSGFAISSVLAIIVMYDAAGVRRASGQHASVLNMLIDYLDSHELKLDKGLK